LSIASLGKKSLTNKYREFIFVNMKMRDDANHCIKYLDNGVILFIIYKTIIAYFV